MEAQIQSILSYTVAILAPLLIGAFWMWYFMTRDAHKKDPRLELFKIASLGAASVYLIALPLYGLVNNYLDISSALTLVSTGGLKGLAYAILVIGVIEEFAKFFVVRLFIVPSKEFNEPFDGVVYAVSAAIGFLVIEDIIYVFGGLRQSGLEGGLITIYARAWTSMGHLMFSAIWGVALGFYKLKVVSKKTVVMAFMLAAIGHGVFDYLLLQNSGSLATYYSFLLIPAIGMWLATISPWMMRISPFAKHKYVVNCPSCLKLTPYEAPCCSHCGLLFPIQDNWQKQCVSCYASFKGDHCPICEQKIRNKIERYLGRFIEKNVDRYSWTFAKFDTNPYVRVTWNWSAFLGGEGWLAYRKMYKTAALVGIAGLIVPVLPRIAMALMGDWLYYSKVQRMVDQGDFRDTGTSIGSGILVESLYLLILGLEFVYLG